MAERVRKGEYGPVLVVKGKHKGRVGYYDDDDDSGCAFVFFDDAVKDIGVCGESLLIPMPDQINRRWLHHTAVTPLFLERWKREYPQFVFYINGFMRDWARYESSLAD